MWNIKSVSFSTAEYLALNLQVLVKNNTLTQSDNESIKLIYSWNNSTLLNSYVVCQILSYKTI